MSCGRRRCTRPACDPAVDRECGVVKARFLPRIGGEGAQGRQPEAVRRVKEATQRQLNPLHEQPHATPEGL